MIPLQLKESQVSTKTFLSQIFFKKSSPMSVQLLDVRKQNRKSTVGQKIENRRSKIENRKSKIENRQSVRKSKIENRKSRIENRKSKVENRKSKIERNSEVSQSVNFFSQRDVYTNLSSGKR